MRYVNTLSRTIAISWCRWAGQLYYVHRTISRKSQGILIFNIRGTVKVTLPACGEGMMALPALEVPAVKASGSNGV